MRVPAASPICDTALSAHARASGVSDAADPEIRRGSGKGHTQSDFAVGGKRPIQRGSEIVDFNAIAPEVIEGGLKLALGSEWREQRETKFRLLPRHLARFAAVCKLLERIGSCRFQQVPAGAGSGPVQHDQ